MNARDHARTHAAQAPRRSCLEITRRPTQLGTLIWESPDDKRGNGTAKAHLDGELMPRGRKETANVQFVELSYEVLVLHPKRAVLYELVLQFLQQGCVLLQRRNTRNTTKKARTRQSRPRLNLNADPVSVAILSGTQNRSQETSLSHIVGSQNGVASSRTVFSLSCTGTLSAYSTSKHRIET